MIFGDGGRGGGGGGVPLTDTAIFQTVETETPNYPNVNRNRKYSW